LTQSALANGQVVEICETRNQHDKTVMYCEHILLVAKRPEP